jgi:alkyl hydroperoxide reductase subunit AhpC
VPTACFLAETSGDGLDRTPADNQTVRNVFVIGPDKKLKLVLAYPAMVAMPVKWRRGAT